MVQEINIKVDSGGIGAGREATQHINAAILRTPRDSRTFPTSLLLSHDRSIPREPA